MEELNKKLERENQDNELSLEVLRAEPKDSKIKLYRQVALLEEEKSKIEEELVKANLKISESERAIVRLKNKVV